MRLLFALTLLLAVVSIVRAFPATKNAPPQIDEEDEDSLGPAPNHPPLIRQDDDPAPNHPPPFRQDDDPHQKHALDESEQMDDNMVIMKRRPFEDYAWPKTGSVVNIPYSNSGVNSAVLARAIEVFNAKTCVRFVARSSEDNYVQFQSSSGSCNAGIGYQQTGMQTCQLTSGCSAKKGKVLHEMMHILSFLHEQCRSDRNSHITVHTDRIRSGYESNFDIIEDSVDQGIPYDCDSILHYKSTAFAATSGQETITSSECSHLGNDDTRLSLLDYKRVNTLYSCGKPNYKYYTVRVVTDSSWLSGTDCFIYLTLHGSAYTSTEFELDLSTDSSANLFESGSDDTFNYMAYRNDLGSISGMSLRMVSHGSGPAWWPTTFTVTDPDTSTSVSFTSNQWLSPSSTYGTDSFNRQ